MVFPKVREETIIAAGAWTKKAKSSDCVVFGAEFVVVWQRRRAHGDVVVSAFNGERRAVDTEAADSDGVASTGGLGGVIWHVVGRACV